MNPGWSHPKPADWIQVVDHALSEDLGPGDLSAACIEPGRRCSWYIEIQAPGIVCGLGIADHLFEKTWVMNRDGDSVKPNDMVIRGEGVSTEVLSIERTALNFLTMMSGTATLTSQYVKVCAGLPIDIIDTRKTLPGLRSLQKYAVRCGGGRPHRMGLYDGLMIKENHIALAGNLEEAMKRAKAGAGHMTKIEVEAETVEQAVQATDLGADIVMLDNMGLDQMREAVDKLKGRVILEASGGVDLSSVRSIAETGVDAISVGALTHSAPALSMHLEIE